MVDTGSHTRLLHLLLLLLCYVGGSFVLSNARPLVWVRTILGILLAWLRIYGLSVNDTLNLNVLLLAHFSWLNLFVLLLLAVMRQMWFDQVHLWSKLGRLFKLLILLFGRTAINGVHYIVVIFPLTLSLFQNLCMDDVWITWDFFLIFSTTTSLRAKGWIEDSCIMPCVMNIWVH